MVLRNIQRRPFHAILTIFVISITVTSLFTSLWLGRGLERGLNLGIQRLGADVIVLPEKAEAKPEQMLFTGTPLSVYMDKSLYKEILSLPGVKQATPQFFTKTIAASCCGLVSPGRIVGLDSNTDFVVAPWMINKLNRPLGDHELIIGSNIDMAVGDRIIIRGELFKTIEHLAPTGTGIDDTAFISMDTARRLAKESPDLQYLWTDKKPDQLFSAILVRVEDPGKTNEIVQAINKLSGVNAVPSLQVVQETRQRMHVVTSLLYALTAVLWLVSLASLLGRFASLVMERKTEIGILRALGARQWGVFRLILWEAGCLALVSALIGTALGWFVSSYLVKTISSGTTFPFLSLSLSETAGLLGWCLLAATATVILAALFPAYRTASLDPAWAIAQGELE
ncbi:MAG: FtsX-like permease family protein [Firmicutes bacterium]|nr:FtsX-like permease family protein [Bacillota bacterium]